MLGILHTILTVTSVLLMLFLLGSFIYVVKQKKPLKYYFFPIVINTFTHMVEFYFGTLFLAIAKVPKTTVIALIFFTIVVLSPTIINLLFYLLYHKRKNKISKQEYILSCFYGLIISLLTMMSGLIF
jgi:hypothetical protein